MARLITSGFETNRVGTVNTEPDGLSAGGAALSIITTSPHSGTYAARCASGAGNSTSFAQFPFTVVGSTSYYLRCYCRFSQLPLSGNIIILSIGTPGTNGASIRLNSSGGLLMWDDKTNAQIGSTLASAITANGTTWYRLEITVTLNATPTVTSVTGRIDGAQIATGSISPTGAMTGLVSCGWVTNPGATRTVDMDDIAFNDSTGGNQNTYPGAGNIVLLVPTADSAIGTGWTLGTGTAISSNSGSTAVKNIAPLGVADLTAGSDTKQVRNAASAASSNFDLTMQTYTAAGVPAGATVMVVDPIVCTGAPSATTPKVGTVGVVSNPAITAINLTGGSGSFYNNVIAAGAYPTGWKWSHGTITYVPSVTLGTAPVMRVTQTTSSALISMICNMGMYVEYFNPITKSGYGKENG